MEIEQRILEGRPHPTVERIIELQKKFQATIAEPLQGLSADRAAHAADVIGQLEVLELKAIEDQILDRTKPLPRNALPKIMPDPDSAPKTQVPPKQVEAFKLLTGRLPTAKEIAKWIRTK